MAYKRNVEIFEEAYEKKDAKSVVSYVARDGRRRYIAGNKNPDGGGTPMPSGGGITEVTWQELKDKRDNGELNPGSLYRITDYQCTTTQENTQSAGHQFDIVLLALSENKLAEEGWAMMNESNVYDVTFTDGITRKCWLYPTVNGRGNDIFNVVDVITLLGCQCGVGNVEINEDTKTATINNMESGTLNEENLTYNYFQHSNLSAWKVWYCLDNDKSRFAWADDSVIGDIENIVVYYPERIGLGGTIPAHDVFYTLTNETQIVNGVTYFKLIKLEGVYTSDVVELFVDTKNINTETTLYEFEPRTSTVQASPWNISIKSINYNTPPTEEGRGVIYRLIDEWGNDVPWDYKNILFTINDETTYSLSMADQDSSDEFDATLNGGTLGVIVNTTHGESRDGRTPKSIYPISRVMLQQCLIYLNEDVSPDSYLFTNNGHANIIYGLEIYDPNA